MRRLCLYAAVLVLVVAGLFAWRSIRDASIRREYEAKYREARARDCSDFLSGLTAGQRLMVEGWPVRTPARTRRELKADQRLKEKAKALCRQ